MASISVWLLWISNLPSLSVPSVPAGFPASPGVSTSSWFSPNFFNTFDTEPGYYTQATSSAGAIPAPEPASFFPAPSNQAAPSDPRALNRLRDQVYSSPFWQAHAPQLSVYLAQLHLGFHQANETAILAFDQCQKSREFLWLTALLQAGQVYEGSPGNKRRAILVTREDFELSQFELPPTSRYFATTPVVNPHVIATDPLP